MFEVGDQVEYEGRSYVVAMEKSNSKWVRLSSSDAVDIWVAREQLEVRRIDNSFDKSNLESPSSPPLEIPNAIDPITQPDWTCGYCGASVEADTVECPSCAVKLPLLDAAEELSFNGVQLRMLVSATSMIVGDTAKAMPETRGGLEWEASEWIELLRKLNVMVGLVG